jgi:hypothetical protein
MWEYDGVNGAPISGDGFPPLQDLLRLKRADPRKKEGHIIPVLWHGLKVSQPRCSRSDSNPVFTDQASPHNETQQSMHCTKD